MSDAPLPDVDSLESLDPERLAELFAQLKERAENGEHERDEYKKLYLLLLEENERLKRGLTGQKAERLRGNDAQLTLEMIAMMLGEDAGKEPASDDEQQTVPEHKRRKPKRKQLPEDLERIDIEILPEEVQREGLDAFEQIGQEVREVLERRPSSLVVVRIVKPKFVRKVADAEAERTVMMAETPELPIERGLAGPGFLADTIVRRWQDHLPLHRLESIYARDGIDLARSTMCGWHEQLAELVSPVVAAMKADALTMPYLCTDATGVLVQAPERCRHGHFWVLAAPERHILYEFTERHDSAAVDQVLAGYRGYLVADAATVYDHLYAGGDVVEAGCWAHGRRYFFKALDTDPDRAREALGRINALFRVERSIANAKAGRKKREAIRKLKSKPIVDAFFKWCHAEKLGVLEHTPIYKAIGYVTNQEQALRRFLEDGRLPLHNNLSELALRREVVGRKNWLFVGSKDGARVNTTFVSLLASCDLHQIEPWAYLRDLLCLVPRWSSHRLLDLAPANWKQTRQDEDAQQLLADNVFRKALLERIV